MHMHNGAPTVVDVFSGCGGMSTGFKDAGFEILLAVDNWAPALRTYSTNHPTSSVMQLDLGSPNSINTLSSISLPRVDVVIGGPPCQGFSISGKRLIDDPRNSLYRGFLATVELYEPKVFVLENVPNMLSIGNGTFYHSLIDEIKSLGYTPFTHILLASSFGVPQNRRRAFIVGLRESHAYSFPDPVYGPGLLPYRTVWDAISDLPAQSVRDGEPYAVEPKSEYQKLMRDGSAGIYNHETTRHTERTKEIIHLVPDGGNYRDLPKDLQMTRKVHIAWTRLASMKPSLTIDTGHRHHFHYRWDRVPTVREVARIQSFPDTFAFSGTRTQQYTQIGNAVPPLLAEVVARTIAEGFL